MVQVGPAVRAAFNTSTIVFITDEEKNTESKTVDYKEEKKYCADYSDLSNKLIDQLNMLIDLAEKIAASPCLEKPTPPPNFC